MSEKKVKLSKNEIIMALHKSDRVLKTAAELLDVHYMTLVKYIQTYNIVFERRTVGRPSSNKSITVGHVSSKPIKVETKPYDWQDDPNFDTGYINPTHEERDEWYNRDSLIKRSQLK